jgi:hypothetical protein
MKSKLPYFKFFPSRWLMGDINDEDDKIKGVFITVCALYWSNNCDITMDKLTRKVHKTKVKGLVNGGYIIEEEGKIKIPFLDSQKEELNELSNKRSEAGRIGRQSQLGQTPDKRQAKPNDSPGNKKENKKKKEKDIYIPTLDEFKNYFLENGFDESVAVRAWTGYNVADWYDSQGNKVKNWKQKCQNVWFKDDNKTKPGKQTTGTVKILQPQEDFRGK